MADDDYLYSDLFQPSDMKQDTEYAERVQDSQYGDTHTHHINHSTHTATHVAPPVAQQPSVYHAPVKHDRVEETRRPTVPTPDVRHSTSSSKYAERGHPREYSAPMRSRSRTPPPAAPRTEYRQEKAHEQRVHSTSHQSSSNKRSRSKDRSDYRRTSRSRSPGYKKPARSRSRSFSPSSREYYRRKKSTYSSSSTSVPTSRHAASSSEHDLEAECDNHLRKGLGSLWEDWQKHRKLCSMSQTRFIRHLLSLHKKFCVSRPSLADCGTQYDPVDQQIALTPGPFPPRGGFQSVPQPPAQTGFPPPGIPTPVFNPQRFPNPPFQTNTMPPVPFVAQQPQTGVPPPNFQQNRFPTNGPPPPAQAAAAMFNSMPPGMNNQQPMNRPQNTFPPQQNVPPPQNNPQFNSQIRPPNQMPFNNQPNMPNMQNNMQGNMMQPGQMQMQNQNMQGNQPMPNNQNMQGNQQGQQMGGNMQQGQQGQQQQKTNFFSLSKNPVVRAYETGQSSNITLSDIKGNVVDFSVSQQGAKFLQEKIGFATPQQLEFMFAEVFENPSKPKTVMISPYGNYFAQMLLERSTPEQKQKFVESVRGSVIELCNSKNGNRVVQKLFESVEEVDKVEIAQEMKGNCVSLAKGYNGGFVLQKAINTISSTHLAFIAEEFTGHEVELATDSQGCRVMQSFVEHFQSAQKEAIIDELLKRVDFMATDRFGNYIIQHIMKFGQPRHQDIIITELKEKVAHYATNKFSSNVLEKCLSDAGPHERAILIDEVCNMDPADFLVMLQDNYANYVINRMVDIADPLQRAELMHLVKPHAQTLSNAKQCAKVLAKMNHYFENGGE